MKQRNTLWLVLLYYAATLWILPQILAERSNYFFTSNADATEILINDGILNDPEFINFMGEVGATGMKGIDLANKNRTYDIDFFEEPDESDLLQDDLDRMLTDLGYDSKDAFNRSFHTMVVDLHQLQLEYPALAQLDRTGWLTIVNQVNEQNPNLLWRSSNGGCDDWCLAEAYAEYLTTLGGLAVTVVSTSVVPPLATIVALGGSALAVFRFLNNLRRCCRES